MVVQAVAAHAWEMVRSMVEKRTPHYDLEDFKAAAHRIGVTTTALRDAAALGFERADITDALLSLRKAHFFKSMTSHRDVNEWQDVYHLPYGTEVYYVKFRADAVLRFMLLSFKEF